MLLEWRPQLRAFQLGPLLRFVNAANPDVIAVLSDATCEYKQIQAAEAAQYTRQLPCAPKNSEEFRVQERLAGIHGSNGRALLVLSRRSRPKRVESPLS